MKELTLDEIVEMNGIGINFNELELTFNEDEHFAAWDALLTVEEILVHAFNYPEAAYSVSGSVITAKAFTERILRLTTGDITTILDNIERNDQPIRNLRNYVITCLYYAAGKRKPSGAAKHDVFSKKRQRM